MRNLVLIIFSLLFLSACSHRKQKSDFFEFKGFGDGAAFTIEYDKNAGNLNAEIYRIIKSVEMSVARSNSSSLLNLINTKDSVVKLDEHFLNLLNSSSRFYKETNKAFDPTIYPLEQFWMEDENKYRNQSRIDSNIIDSIKKMVGFEYLFMSDNNVLVKKYPGMIIDFKNIYLGYTVDLIANLFSSYHVVNYRIELNGRIRAKGHNSFGKKWDIPLDEPTDNSKSRELLAISTLDDQGYCTTGSYRTFVSYGQKKLPFTIDPRTGYPVKHSLISATVFANTCMEAEAYSSAFMIMGPELTKSFIYAHPDLQVYLISTNYKGEWITYISDGLKEKIEMVKDDFQ